MRTTGGFWDLGPFEDGWAYEVPEEFYLRAVMDVDLDSPESVGDFVAANGFLLYGGEDYRHRVELGWSYARALDGWPERFSEQLIIAMEGKFFGDLRHEWHAAEEERFGKGKYLQGEVSPMYELLIETRAGLSALRDLTRVVQHWHRNRLRTMPKVWELSIFDVDPPKDAAEAFDFMVGAMNGAIRDISARLITGADERVGATLYVAAVAQMFNHLVEGSDYKTCANETCRRVFVHQVEGVSEYGQYRSEGVIYCSNRCARAQAQREYRRRQRKP
jgi:hypothetical protein